MKTVSAYVVGEVRPSAVVADGSWVKGLAAVRPLARAGGPVVVIDDRGPALAQPLRLLRGRLR